MCVLILCAMIANAETGELQIAAEQVRELLQKSTDTGRCSKCTTRQTHTMHMAIIVTMVHVFGNGNGIGVTVTVVVTGHAKQLTSELYTYKFKAYYIPPAPANPGIEQITFDKIRFLQLLHFCSLDFTEIPSCTNQVLGSATYYLKTFKLKTSQ